MIDDGCSVQGYNSDITRTFVYETTSDEMKRVFDVRHRAQKAALQIARPGTECRAVDAAVRNVIGDTGYSRRQILCVPLGHGPSASLEHPFST
jgi:Xaa-Pro dipeptidase